jgi:phosphatidylglycerol---prolipoprotein diacylglyceryl transferase
MSHALIYTSDVIHWVDLGLQRAAFSVFGYFDVRWYSLAYITGILVGWWQLTRILDQPGAPMARRHADDFILYATLGIILGGRLGYVLGYQPDILKHPLDVFRLWEGGMSFHGGVVGVMLGIFYLVRKQGLNWLRVHDYVAICVPAGMFFGRIANFVNGELWGRPTDVPWAMIFPVDELPRHPSQLYHAGLEGLLLGIILWFMFKKTEARYYPGRLVGTFALLMGAFRIFIEFFREPDVGVALTMGLSRGQLLSLPLVVVGIYLLVTSAKRRQRVEAIAGHASIG